MEQDTHSRVVRSLVVLEVLDSTSLAQNDGVGRFQVGRVGDQRKGDLFAGRCGTDVVGTEMIFNISSRPVVIFITGELVKDGLNRFTNDVGEDVETTTMRHTNGDVFDAIVDRAVDECLHTRDESFAPFKAETLLIGVLARDEFLEGFGPNEAIQDHALLFDGVVPRLGCLDAFPDPVTLLLVRYVHILNTNMATCVGYLVGGDDP